MVLHINVKFLHREIIISGFNIFCLTVTIAVEKGMKNTISIRIYRRQYKRIQS